ncbi:WLM domain protein [Methanobrevibacter cuticularis]|uniref:WLM domain protein n=1 Tax=Methanobrevibacter cuticularis TaxID=47311 RepID=A0A166CJC7_9EURY|nr:SprT family zinc-dependent metalloprotease [Methanobrevibacter cuticularis]KZX14817.1 WLM domain protein [Methanobrevibacter cuticularis]
MREYKLIQSKRKTISLKIKEDASLEVRAPLQISKKEIDNFINKKESWINKHVKIMKERYDNKKEFKLDYGDSVLVRGNSTFIYPIEGNIAKYEDSSFLIPKKFTPYEIKQIIIELYKLIAKSYIRKRVNFFKEKMNVEPTAIRITSAKTRWGSCSGKNSVNFSWRLIMGDDEIIDYVIVHELAHIKQHNHSSKFWEIVDSILPDYMIRMNKLRILEKKIAEENWD